MKNSSLDAEPPSIAGEKEVNRKKGNHNQLILLLKNEKVKGKQIDPVKNLEKQIRLDFQDYVFDSSYLKTNNGFAEETSTTAKTIAFTSALNINLNQIISDNNYWRNKNDTYFIDKKKSADFYEKKSSYSFASPVNEEVKKENLSAQYKEQDNQEILYTLYLAEEEPIPENLKKF
jgi:hypothetical protein